MRRILFVLACSIGLFSGMSAFAQSTTGNGVVQTQRTRARVVTSPTPPVLQGGSTSNQNTDRRGGPPVLQGKSNPAPSPTPPPLPQTNQNNGAGAIEDDEDENAVIQIETNLVTMPVSVLDRDGRFITGLRQQDFRIFENGVEQKVDYFASVEQPFTVVLLIDVSPSTQYRIEEIQDAAIAFVDQLRRDDKVIVMSFDERVHVLSPVTNNRNVLRNAIRQADFGEGTSLYEAVNYTINQQLKYIPGRKAIVLFTDGVDTTSRRANYQSTLREAEELDALIYPIRYDTFAAMNPGYGGGGRRGGGYPNPYPQRRRGGWGDILGDILGGGVIIGGGGGGRYPQGGGGGAGSSRSEYETGRRYLEELARTTGGRNFEASNNLNAAFTGIAEELRRQYTIGYYPDKAGQKGERRQIRVRVMRPNLVVKAKTSYIVGANNTTNQAGK